MLCTWLSTCKMRFYPSTVHGRKDRKLYETMSNITLHQGCMFELTVGNNIGKNPKYHKDLEACFPISVDSTEATQPDMQERADSVDSVVYLDTRIRWCY